MALQLADRGVDVETHLWRGQVHAFPVMVDLIPESRQALKLAADFARRAVGELEPETEFDAAADPDAHEEPIIGEMVSDDHVPDDGEDIIDVELEGDTGKKRWFFQAS